MECYLSEIISPIDCGTLTVHGHAVGRLGVLQVRVDRRHVVLEVGSVHEVRALRVFEESGFH